MFQNRITRKQKMKMKRSNFFANFDLNYNFPKTHAKRENSVMHPFNAHAYIVYKANVI